MSTPIPPNDTFTIAHDLALDLAEDELRDRLAEAFVADAATLAHAIRVRSLSQKAWSGPPSVEDSYYLSREAVYGAVYSLLEGYKGWKLVRMDEGDSKPVPGPYDASKDPSWRIPSDAEILGKPTMSPLSVYSAGLLVPDRPVVFADEARAVEAKLATTKAAHDRLRTRLMQAHAYLLTEWRANRLSGPMGDALIESLNEPV